MKITIKTGEYTHSYDSSVDDTIDGGWLHQYHPSVEEAVDAALLLLGDVYPRAEIAKYLRKGNLPAMDYDKEPA